MPSLVNSRNYSSKSWVCFSDNHYKILKITSSSLLQPELSMKEVSSICIFLIYSTTIMQWSGILKEVHYLVLRFFFTNSPTNSFAEFSVRYLVGWSSVKTYNIKSGLVSLPFPMLMGVDFLLAIQIWLIFMLNLLPNYILFSTHPSLFHQNCPW